MRGGGEGGGGYSAKYNARQRNRSELVVLGRSFVFETRSKTMRTRCSPPPQNQIHTKKKEKRIKFKTCMEKEEE